ncbi:hypothetical protein SAMN04490244_10836 [Tranquillimonas rosea]|uniref:Uncharacterized protein n=1 Tax=Tranquillimonas rosea TaxID=641238 RepID=A0A1H9VRQ8_9RHOB|nr:hypothetical protein [Tranquillimonas rosea]SES24231.1 hypothetical protein SAMN04490244_10836 [Tranquillimonas rosea]
MTALKEYQRLEASGLWRSDPDAQRRDVVISVGHATLTIFDLRERALSHWSLAAIERLNPGKTPALFAPGSAADETLEIDDDTMIEAIERVRTAVSRRRPRQGRLRLGLVLATLAAVVALGVFWLPGALIGHAARVAPPAMRTEIGTDMLRAMRRVSGAPCESRAGRRALSQLSQRLMDGTGRIVVLRDGVQTTEHLPGDIYLVNRALVEDFDSPDPLAGYLLAEMERADRRDPLLRLLKWAGPFSAVRLLTTGEVKADTLNAHAEALLLRPPLQVSRKPLLDRFAEAHVPAAPYAFARDVTGETTLSLIEADPVPPEDARPVLEDRAWVALQGICGA